MLEKTPSLKLCIHLFIICKKSRILHIKKNPTKYFELSLGQAAASNSRLRQVITKVACMKVDHAACPRGLMTRIGCDAAACSVSVTRDRSRRRY